MSETLREREAGDPEAGAVLVSVREAAGRLGVSERTVWRLLDRGELRALRLGRVVRIPVASLQSLVARAE
jgi:excisionase family DNA binding protein